MLFTRSVAWPRKARKWSFSSIVSKSNIRCIWQSAFGFLLSQKNDQWPGISCPREPATHHRHRCALLTSIWRRKPCSQLVLLIIKELSMQKTWAPPPIGWQCNRCFRKVYKRDLRIIVSTCCLYLPPVPFKHDVQLHIPGLDDSQGSLHFDDSVVLSVFETHRTEGHSFSLVERGRCKPWSKPLKWQFPINPSSHGPLGTDEGTRGLLTILSPHDKLHFPGFTVGSCDCLKGYDDAFGADEAISALAQFLSWTSASFRWNADRLSRRARGSIIL